MATIETRKGIDGSVSYRAKVRLKGHPAESATFERLTDAKRWIQNTESAIREGRHFKTSQARKHTLSSLIDRYTKEILDLSDRPTYNQRLYLKYWKERLGDYVLADITPSLIADHRNKLMGSTNRYGKKRSATSGNRYTTALGHVFTIAIKQWELMDGNPAQRVQKLKEPKGRVRFLSDEERSALLEACKESENPYLYIVTVLALSTGARKSELLTLKWKDVNLNRGRVTLHETKNGERRAMHLQGYALQLMKEHAKAREIASEYVFPSEQKPSQPIDIRTAWENAVKYAGLKDFRFHDLRHSAASYLAMNGASLAEIAEVLGHKTLQMVKRYAHLSETHTSKVVAAMNQKIFG